MNKGLVSIIIPIYNVAQYLDDCIKSACEQTYKNIEIILIDDGSTDGSAEICDKWAEKDIRIKVIHKKNGGLSDARNAGLEVSKGKYLLFLDGDDSVELNLLDISISKMVDGAEMVAFGYNLIYSDGSTQKVSFPDKNYILRTDKDKINCLLGPFFRYEIGWNAWNRVFLKSIIDDYKIRFVDNKRIFAEDQLFCLCYIAHCSNLVVIDECLYNYFQREDSIMNSVRRNHILRFGQTNELSKEALAHFKKYADCNYLIPVFSAIHYMLFEQPIIQEGSYFGKLNELRETIYEDVREKSDVKYFIEQYRDFLEKSKVLNYEYDCIRRLEKVCRTKWLLNGHSLSYTVFFNIRKVLR